MTDRPTELLSLEIEQNAAPVPMGFMTVKSAIFYCLIGLGIACSYLIYSHTTLGLWQTSDKNGRLAGSIYYARGHVLFCYQTEGSTALCWPLDHKNPLLCRAQADRDMICSSAKYYPSNSIQGQLQNLILEPPRSTDQQLKLSAQYSYPAS
jgi:hypothetical protein